MQLSIEKVHFISGLPRSGSTLLSAILQQNPRFSAGMTSPVSSLFTAVLPKMSGGSEFASFYTEERRCRMLEGMFSAYHYDDLHQNKLVFDTNRIWTARLSLIDKLFPTARVICCVRDVPWVIDSVEKMVRRNPAHVSSMFNGKGSRNIYGRVEHLMNPDDGLIGLAWGSLREAWFGEHTDKLIVIRYDSLAKEPSKVVARLYELLGEPFFKHDFENVSYSEEVYDHRLGMPDLHTVGRRVEFKERPTILPPDIFMKYADTNFWGNDKLNTKGVVVL